MVQAQRGLAQAQMWLNPGRVISRRTPREPHGRGRRKGAVRRWGQRKSGRNKTGLGQRGTWARPRPGPVIGIGPWSVVSISCGIAQYLVLGTSESFSSESCWWTQYLMSANRLTNCAISQEVEAQGLETQKAWVTVARNNVSVHVRLRVRMRAFARAYAQG